MTVGIPVFERLKKVLVKSLLTKPINSFCEGKNIMERDSRVDLSL